MGWTQQEALQKTGTCPLGHQHPGRDHVFEMETACPKVPSYTLSACTPSLWDAVRPGPIGQPYEKVHLHVGPVFLALALALIPGASGNWSGTTP